MADLIDRQATLKHIEKIRQGVQMMDDTHRASIIMNGMHLCEEAVRNQPSILIVLCKDCKYYNPIGVCIEMSSAVCEDSFCCWAERRTDE